MKIDIHNHILPETWPDLKKVSFEFLISLLQNMDTNNEEVCVKFIAEFVIDLALWLWRLGSTRSRVV